MKIAVIGAGAMGCMFGGLLQNHGEEVTFIDVGKQNIVAMNKQGLILELDQGTLTLPMTAAEAQDVQGSYDLIILFTKTLHSSAALAASAHLIDDNTVVVSLQNGLGNVEKIEKHVPRNRILIGTTLVPADLKAPGHVASHGTSHSKIMTADGQQNDDLHQVVDLFNAAGLNCDIDPNVTATIWSKVAFNAAFNSICAITGSTPGTIADCSQSVQLVREVIAETVQIAKTAGIELDESAINANADLAMREHRSHKPSMLQDIENGRATEVDALNGAIVQQAKQLGIEAPINETLWSLVKLTEHKRLN
jgi:2-dehydropantoate 2-reductase